MSNSQTWSQRMQPCKLMLSCPSPSPLRFRSPNAGCTSQERMLTQTIRYSFNVGFLHSVQGSFESDTVSTRCMVACVACAIAGCRLLGNLSLQSTCISCQAEACILLAARSCQFSSFSQCTVAVCKTRISLQSVLIASPKLHVTVSSLFIVIHSTQVVLSIDAK